MKEKKTLKQIMEQPPIDSAEILKTTFCERLKELRQEKDMSQKDVAYKLNVPVSTYANWEQGRREPSIYDIYNLLWVFETDANDLFAIDF